MRFHAVGTNETRLLSWDETSQLAPQFVKLEPSSEVAFEEVAELEATLYKPSFDQE